MIDHSCQAFNISEFEIPLNFDKNDPAVYSCVALGLMSLLFDLIENSTIRIESGAIPIPRDEYTGILVSIKIFSRSIHRSGFVAIFCVDVRQRVGSNPLRSKNVLNPAVNVSEWDSLTVYREGFELDLCALDLRAYTAS